MPPLAQQHVFRLLLSKLGSLALGSLVLGVRPVRTFERISAATRAMQRRMLALTFASPSDSLKRSSASRSDGARAVPSANPSPRTPPTRQRASGATARGQGSARVSANNIACDPRHCWFNKATREVAPWLVRRRPLGECSVEIGSPDTTSLQSAQLERIARAWMESARRGERCSVEIRHRSIDVAECAAVRRATAFSMSATRRMCAFEGGLLVRAHRKPLGRSVGAYHDV
jgi:hypothetical protein